MRLNQVTMPRTNVAESVEFYTKLGLIQIVASDHYARFVCPTETRLSPPAWWTRSTAGLSPSCTSSATTSTAPSESLNQRTSFSTHGPRISGGCGAKRGCTTRPTTRYACITPTRTGSTRRGVSRRLSSHTNPQASDNPWLAARDCDQNGLFCDHRRTPQQA